SAVARTAGQLAIPEDLLDGQVGRNSADAAARVARRAGLVEAADGSVEVGISGCRPHVEQLVDRELTVKDVAADQPKLLLEVEGSQDLPVQDRAPEVWGALVVAIDHPVGVRLQLLAMRGLAPFLRHPLREHGE